MKKSVFLIGCLISTICIAQNKAITISGEVFIDNIPTETAVVTVFTQKDTVSLITNKNGRYTFKNIIVDASEKRVFVEASYFGYVNNNNELALSEATTYNVNLYLKEDIQEIDEVVIVSQKSNIKNQVNKLSYNVRKSDFIENTKATTVLNSVPTVSYNKAVGVQIDGNRNALVFIDGIEASTEELESLDAKTVKAVEVVRNPSAKYGPEFGGGVINVVLRKTDSLYYKAIVRVGQGTLLKSRSYAPQLSIKTNTLSVKGFYNYFENAQEVAYNVIRDPGKTSFYEQSSRRKPTTTQGSSQLTIKYIPSENNVLYLKGAYVLNEEQGEINGFFSNSGNSNIPFKNNSENNYTQYTVDGVYEKKINKNLFTAKGRFITYQRANVFQFNSIEDNTLVNTRSNFDEYSGAADYQINSFTLIKPEATLNTGFKYIYRSYTFNDDPFVLNQTISSAYADVATKLSSKTGAFISLYLENVMNENDNFSTTSFNFLPSLTLNQNLSSKSSLELSYSKRIRRPNAYDLNETEVILNPGIIEKGNQLLLPEQTQRFSIRYGQVLRKRGYLSINPFFESTADAILQSIDERDGVLLYSKSNIGDVTKYGMGMSFSTTFLKVLRSNLTLGVRYDEFKNATQINSGTTFYGNLFISSSFLKDKVYASFYASTNNPAYNFVSRTSSRPFTTLSVSTNFWKDKISLSIDYNDLFRLTAKRKILIDNSEIYQLTRLNSNFSNALVTIAYNFGDSFNDRYRVKTIQNEDVKN